MTCPETRAPFPTSLHSVLRQAQHLRGQYKAEDNSSEQSVNKWWECRVQSLSPRTRSYRSPGPLDPQERCCPDRPP
ncbi:hypothetical protein NDU88_007658 [Pleurodeles waltl]|uniref:Uncharacterized protein n=1 Tax=Pleurodeles waltl TaxID=8319 RepID=A0AAV7PPX4_PLEWA|nr:hypothetical protein NDU88_007658 [Pleurodeles waltl]